MEEMAKYRSCIILVALAMMIAITAAQTICSGFLKDPNPVQGDVVVKSGDYCSLGTSVTGSVTVNPGGSLNTTNALVINGKISVHNASEVRLGLNDSRHYRSKNNDDVRNISVTIRGGLDVVESKHVFVMKDTYVAKVKTHKIEELTLMGVAESVDMVGGGRLFVDGGKVMNGISQIRAESTDLDPVKIVGCGADLFGGIKVINVTGVDAYVYAIPKVTCPITRADGELYLENSSAEVSIPSAHEFLVGVKLINVTSHYSQIYHANLSHVAVSGYSGTLEFVGGRLNHGATFRGFKQFDDYFPGVIRLEYMKMFGDFKFVDNSEIEMNRNNFTGKLECSGNRNVYGKFNRMRPSAITVIGDCSSTFVR